MASVAELERKIADLTFRVNGANEILKRQQQTLEFNLSEAAKFTAEAATYPEGSALQLRTLEQAAKQNANAEYLKANQLVNAQSEADGWAQQLAEANQALTAAKTAEANKPAPAAEPAPPPGSAATAVAASDAGATQNPAPPPATTGRLTTTEAEKLAAKTETGTDAPVRTLTETQSVDNTKGLPIYNEEGALATSRRNPETGELYTPLSEGRPGGEPGVGAKGEDGATAANTKQILDTVGNKPFQPKANVLDQYASYTYNIGWYLMTPAQYKNLQNTAKPSISQYNLLMQSGGAPSTVSGVQPELTNGGTVANVAATAGRNPFFGLDYYLDNLEIKSVITGKGTNRAGNEASLKFTVTEPANITLINNLWKAVKDLYGDNKVGYVDGYYALVIRFYGYDDSGKIVQARNSDNSNAVVQKIIPFKIANIEFSVTNRLVEYQVTGVGVPYDVGFGSNLGVIKARIEVSGATVKDLLTKGVDPEKASADDGRKTTPTAKSSVSPEALAATGADYNLTNNDGMAFNLLSG